MRKLTHIVIHCTATPASMDIGADRINEWHLTKGWSGIGYHFVVKRDGTVEDGRPIERAGAHVKGFNAESIGVALVGGVSDADHTKSENNFPDVQIVEALRFVHNLRKEHNIPIENVMGHKEVIAQITHGSPKDCPVYPMENFRTALNTLQGMEETTQPVVEPPKPEWNASNTTHAHAFTNGEVCFMAICDEATRDYLLAKLNS